MKLTPLNEMTPEEQVLAFNAGRAAVVTATLVRPDGTTTFCDRLWMITPLSVAHAREVAQDVIRRTFPFDTIKEGSLVIEMISAGSTL